MTTSVSHVQIRYNKDIYPLYHFSGHCSPLGYDDYSLIVLNQKARIQVRKGVLCLPSAWTLNTECISKATFSLPLPFNLHLELLFMFPYPYSLFLFTCLISILGCPNRAAVLPEQPSSLSHAPPWAVLFPEQCSSVLLQSWGKSCPPTVSTIKAWTILH